MKHALERRQCCVENFGEALDEALSQAKPEIFNSDQGTQFTATTFTNRLETAGVAISVDGRGWAIDNVFIERLWRSVKYEEVYLRDYTNGWHTGWCLSTCAQLFRAFP